jgi:hypothetical protein
MMSVDAASDLTVAQFWFLGPDIPDAPEPQAMEDEGQKDIVDAIKRLSERMPERGGKFDLFNEIEPEIERWRKEQKSATPS